MPAPEDIRFRVGVQKDAIIAEYTVKTTGWQGVQNAGLAIAGISVAGLATGSLATPSALALGIAGGFLALGESTMVRMYGRVFRQRIEGLFKQSGTLKPGD